MSNGTIVFDFDGVIHKYSKGWQDGTIYDEPVPGIRELIEELRKDYKVVIVSSRIKNQKQFQEMFKWLQKYSIKVDDITHEKVPALVYVDDRTILFNGKTSNLKYQIKNFRTWNEKNLELMKMSSMETDILLKQRQYEINNIMKELGKVQTKDVIKIFDECIAIANNFIERD